MVATDMSTKEVEESRRGACNELTPINGSKKTQRK